MTDNLVELNDNNEPVPSTEPKGIQLQSLIDLNNDVGAGLEKFVKANSEASVNIVMQSVFNTFLSFVYAWFEQSQQTDKFVTVVAGEAANFHKMVNDAAEARKAVVEEVKQED